jgi:hypothetical protein
MRGHVLSAEKKGRFIIGNSLYLLRTLLYSLRIAAIYCGHQNLLGNMILALQRFGSEGGVCINSFIIRE